MLCPKCGTQNDDNAFKCVNCGNILQQVEQPTPRPRPEAVPTYLAHAILVTLFCFLPTGIVAIVYAARVSSQLAAGDYDGALQSSRRARKWCWVSFAAGLVIAVVYFLVLIPYYY